MSTTEAPAPAAAGVIGQRLLRREDPALLTGEARFTSDLDVPDVPDVRSITLGHPFTPSPTNQLGVKGVGEAGTIGAAPAVIHAVVDALSGLGVTDVPMPASPFNVWMAIHGASTKSDTAGTDVGDHTGVTARTTTASPDDGGQS